MKAMNPAFRNEQRVEELTQDVLLSIHQKRSTYRPEMPLLPWVYAIARYRLIDSIRQETRRPKTVAWEREFEEIADRAAFEGQAAGSPNAGDSGAPDRTDLEEALRSLSARQREVLTLAKLQELPLAEVAKKTNMSLSAVKVTIHRAVQALRKKQERSSRAGKKD